jgi:outer membrane protein assembly factor BamC
MNVKIRLLISVAILLNLSACSVIKSYFPDKEKDYQFTTEIPDLIVPPDLAPNSPAKAPAIAAPVAQAVEAPPVTHKIDTVPDVDRKLIQVELVAAEEGTRRLHISAPESMAWRLVSKALSRKFLEVTDHNQEKALFHVLYDSNKQKPVDDDSFLGEVGFLFKGFVSGEREYILKLIENNAQTDVIILDKEEKPVADEASLSLLTLLHDTIKADLAANK